ncbi:NAD-dependent deacetylase [Kordia sp. SMS9]|uniref:SIR2 family protein n=1 Tax=Kordia sp. SMS9 TaxID=2282170 RepID=UPI000E0D2121|nr:SIR2 family protein [Kordia sp. SMS9]AXG69584.1 NAD-dependent deacetylase [Kordia sp. SMS9]
MKKNRFNNQVASIKEAVDTDRLVVFAGAGVSKDSGIPLWRELEKGIESHLNETLYESDALKIAQMLYNEKGEKEYNDIIKKILFKNKSSYNPLHEILFELNPQHIITTNYDDYFETVIYDNGLPFSTVSKDQDVPYARHKKLLLKYHGDFENHNIVLKENDYLQFSKNHTLKEVFVKALFSNKVVLFVGYSVSDPNLKILIKDIQHILKKHYQRAYLLTTKTDVSITEIKYFENLGINIIVQDSSINIKLSNKPQLSNIGLKVYSQLEYIRDFNVYNYRNLCDDYSLEDNKVKKSRIINDLYNSILRFHYLRVLPQKTLANLYPIYKDARSKAAYLIRGATLNTFNKELYQLISDYSGYDDDNFSSEDKEKLNYSLSRIGMSGLYSLGRVDMPDSWGSYAAEEETDILSKIKVDHNCKCIDCTLNSFDYSRALEKIFKYVITDKTTLWDDLIYYHGLYRVRDYYKSYLALKDIILKANRLNRLDVSFIAKYNIKRLKWAIPEEYIYGRMNYNDIRAIESEIEKIDLNEELDKAKYFVDKDVFDLLIEIKDGAYIQRLCNEIDEIFIKVPKTVESIENGGSHSSNVFNNLHRSVKKLKDFLELNFILGNGFSPIESTLRKSIETFILGYYLKDFAEIRKHNFRVSHIQTFDLFMFNLLVEDSNPKEIIRVLEKYEIKNIEVESKSLGKICFRINNFFKSSYTISRHFDNKPRKNEIFISTVTQNESFQKKLKSKFNTICVIMAYFEFTKEQFKILYSNLNYFIEFMNFNERDFDFFAKIIEKKSKIIDTEYLNKTVQIFDKKNIINNSYVALLDALKKKDKNYEHRSISVETLDLDKLHFDISIVYKVVNRDKKKILKKRIEEKLEEAPDLQMYYIAIKQKILSSKKVKNKYKGFIVKNLEVELAEQGTNNELFQFKIKQFFDLVNIGFLDIENIDIDNISEERFKFLLNPEGYDPKKFDVNWLKFYNWDSYSKRYADIEYIELAIQESLREKFDKNLGEFYFKMRKYKS